MLFVQLGDERRLGLQEAGAGQNQVGEVEGVLLGQACLVARVDARDGLLGRRVGHGDKLIRRQPTFFRAGNDLGHEQRRPDALGQAGLRQRPAQDAVRGRLVVDAQFGRPAIFRRPAGEFGGQDQPGVSVDGADGEIVDVVSQPQLQPLAHLRGCLARESQRQDVVLPGQALLDQARLALDEKGGLAGAVPGKDFHRAALVLDGLELGRVNAITGEAWLAIWSHPFHYGLVRLG